MKQFDGEPGEENAYIYAGSGRAMAWIGGLVAASILLLAIASVIRN